MSTESSSPECATSTSARMLIGIACVANFIDLFQSSMVLFSLPSIQRDLDFSLIDLNWVVLAYSLTFATFLLPAGQMADRLGPRNVFLCGTFTLTWTNALSAFAPNMKALIAGRALAGFGAAAVSATGIPLITRVSSPGKMRDTAMAIYISCAPVGTILGVVLGALLSASSVGWRSNFWIILILAGLVTLLAAIAIPKFTLDERKTPIDFAGHATFISGTALFVYGLNDAERLGWSAAPIVIGLVLGGLLLVAFVFLEKRNPHPVLPPNILFDRRVVATLSTFAVTGGCWVTWFYVATQISLNSLQYRTILAACYFLPATAAAIVGGAIGNFFVSKGLAKLSIHGGFILGIGMLIPWAFVGPSHGIWYVIVFAMLFLVSQPPITVGAQKLILDDVAIKDHGVASAAMYVAYQLGSSLFLAIVNVVLGNSDESNPQSLLQGYRNSFWALTGIMAMGFAIFVACHTIEDLLRHHKTKRAASSDSTDHASEVSCKPLES